MELGIGEGVEGIVDAGAQQVARRLGAYKRQHQIGAFLHPRLAQGDAHVVVVIGDAYLAGHVDQPADAHRGIDHHAAKGVADFGTVALQHVIGQDHRRIQVGQEIVHPVAGHFRHHVAIALGDGAGHGMVQLHVEIEDGAVGLFPGVTLCQRLGAGRGARAKRQAHCQRRQDRKRSLHAPTNARLEIKYRYSGIL